MSETNWLSAVRFGADGLVPVVAQESRSGDVLMVAYANREALERTAATGQAHYYSRSRAALWRKGETSGHVQAVREIRLDCDGDTVLYRVEQTGPACHTGTPTCFATAVGAGRRRRSTGEDPRRPPADAGWRPRSPTARPDRPGGLVHGRAARRAACPRSRRRSARRPSRSSSRRMRRMHERLASEAADLLYHLLVLLQARGVPLDAVWKELAQRSR